MKKYKLFKINHSSYMPISNVSIRKIGKTVLVNTTTKTETQELDPIIVSSDNVLKDNREYVQDKLLVGNELTTTINTYENINQTNSVNTKFLGIYNDKKTINKIKNEFEKKQEQIKQNIIKQDGTYDYKIVAKTINVPNKTIIKENTSVNNVIKDTINELKDNSKIKSVTEGIKVELEPINITNIYEDENTALKEIDNLKNDNNNTNVVSNITPIRDNKKDKEEITTSIVNNKKQADDLVSTSDDTNIYSYEEILERKTKKINYDNIKSSNDVELCIDKTIKEGHEITSKIINPIYIKRKIDELYDEEEDAVNRKNEIKNRYPNEEVIIKKERDITKDLEDTTILDKQYQDYDSALKFIQTCDEDASIITINRLETKTIDNESYDSEIDALNRVHEIKHMSAKDIPIHYSITKRDDSFYLLSGAYFIYIPYYQIEVTNIIKGYDYRVLADIPVVDSYSINLEVVHKVPKYKVTRKKIIPGYKYKCNISYNKKNYKKIYKIESVTPKYELFVKGKGSYNVTEKFEKKDVKQQPIYRYDTKIKAITPDKTKTNDYQLIKTRKVG